MNKLNNSTEMSRGTNLNSIKLIGTIARNAEFSHSVVRKDEAGSVNIAFHRFALEVPRLSGVSDFLEVVISEKTWLEAFNHHEYAQGEGFPQVTQAVVEIFGRIQSRNCIESVTGKNKLDLFVFAKSIRVLPKATTGVETAEDNNAVAKSEKKESLNTVILDGFLCKNPVIRQTPHGRTIADLFIAVNRRGGSTYIPVILWGGNAANAKNLKVGDKLRLEGRFQSREYMKSKDGQMVTLTAYEMSASKVKLLE